MRVQILKLSQIPENPTNPRTITPEALEGLQDSILAFPKMQEIRPIIVDGINTALGGNMRIRALNGIAGMGIEEIKERLGRKRSFTSKPEAEQAEIIIYWNAWLQKKTAYIVRASDLTESEKAQFMVKDNVSYGEWDTAGLKEIGQDLLDEWGLDVDLSSVDEPEAPEQGGNTTGAEKTGISVSDEALPEELQGVDLTPDVLPKYEGTEETKCDYIAVSYKESEREAAAEALGVDPDVIFTKICWDYDTYLKMRR